MMSTARFTLSAHAIERALDMALDGDEIRRAVETPSEVRPDPRGGVECRTAGRIVVVFNPAARVVVTVYWRYQAQRKADANRGAYYGREAESPKHAQHRAAKRAHKARLDRAFDGRRSNRRRRDYSDQD